MNFRKGPALLGVVIAVVAVVVVVVVGGSQDQRTPAASPADQVAGDSAASGRDGTSERPGRKGADREGESDNGGQEEPEPAQPVIELEEGQPVGGVRELAYSPGDTIRFAVDSDVDDEIHFHGYDVSIPVKAGEQSQVVVKATIEGVFEVELEDRVIPIAEVTVSP